MDKCRCPECGHEHERKLKVGTEKSVRERIERVERDLRTEIQKEHFQRAINGRKEVSVEYPYNFFPDSGSSEFEAIRKGLEEKFKEAFWFSILEPDPYKGVFGFTVQLQIDELYS